MPKALAPTIAELTFSLINLKILNGSSYIISVLICGDAAQNA